MKKNSLTNLFHLRSLYGVLSMAKKGYLVDTGWLLSYQKKQSLSYEGDPIPWFTYSILDFLKGRLRKDMRLLEYGSGNSTLFFSARIDHVVSVEHDRIWYDRVKDQLPASVSYHFQPLEGTAYQDFILQADGEFDVVIVDGRERMACLPNVVKKLSARGVVILDDSERDKYAESFGFMAQQGFKHIPFSGIAIGAIHPKCTSVFYREGNVLGI